MPTIDVQYVSSLMKLGENVEVDFKREPSSDLPSHIVSFANSSTGGYLLIGVEETTSSSGAQEGTLWNGKGIELTDDNKLRVMNRVQECRDGLVDEVDLTPVDFGSNYGVYVLFIPSGKSKPYCTQNGRYTIRSNGRLSPLFPTILRRLLTSKPDVRNLIQEIEQEKTEFLKLHFGDYDKQGDERNALFQRMKDTLNDPLLAGKDFIEKLEKEGFGGGYKETKEKFTYEGEEYPKRFTWSTSVLEWLDDAITYLKRLGN